MLNLIAAEGPNGVHLASDINEVIWGSVAFFVIFGLIVWKAGPLITRAIQDRTVKIEAELADAKAARQKAEEALTASTSDLPDVGAEALRIRNEAEATAAKLKDDLIAKAEAEAESIKERGRNDVATRKRQAQADLTAEVAQMTRSSAEAVVLEGLDDAAQTDLIETYINRVSQMS